MPLRMSRINRLSLVGQKPVRKPKKKLTGRVNLRTGMNPKIKMSD